MAHTLRELKKPIRKLRTQDMITALGNLPKAGYTFESGALGGAATKDVVVLHNPTTKTLKITSKRVGCPDGWKTLWPRQKSAEIAQEAAEMIQRVFSYSRGGEGDPAHEALERFESTVESILADEDD